MIYGQTSCNKQWKLVLDSGSMITQNTNTVSYELLDSGGGVLLLGNIPKANRRLTNMHKNSKFHLTNR